MKLAILILKEEEKLDEFVNICSKEKIKNITVLESNSYEDEKVGNKKKNGFHILSSIRFALDYYSDESRTILIPVSVEQLSKIKKILSNLLVIENYTLMVIDINEIIGLEK